jgi:hypothetical protein
VPNSVESDSHTPESDTDDVWLPETAFRKLKIGRTRGYAMLRAGTFPGSFRLGARYRISRPAFERFLRGE